MKKRVFIIGAGFSKAIAEAPLVNEFISPMYNSALNKTLSNRIDRVDYESAFLALIDHFKKSVEPGLQFFEKDGTRIKNRMGELLVSSMNIEHLTTFIDLNIERPFIPEGIGVDLQSCPIPYFDKMTVHNFEDAKTFVIHNIIQLLLPDSLKINNQLCSKFCKIFKPGDSVITFNYDVLIEQILYSAGLWHPLDGYLLGKIDSFLKLKPDSVFKTNVPIIKLHGSINWQEPSLFEDDIELFITHPLSHEPFFEGLDFNCEVKRVTDYKILSAFLISPTFMKSFKSKYELYLIKRAINIISQCEEIITLGYSFPEADSLTTFILTQIPLNIPIKIVDLNADLIKEKLVKTYGLNGKKIIHEKAGISDWIQNDFKFTEYRKHIIEEREINYLLGINRNKNG